jgi:hypothetical protein
MDTHRTSGLGGYVQMNRLSLREISGGSSSRLPENYQSILEEFVE